MSGRKYPRIGHARDMRKKWTKLDKRTRAVVPVNNAPRCVVCGQPATHMVDVEVNWFRGDDEVRKACADHKDDAAALIAPPAVAPIDAREAAHQRWLDEQPTNPLSPGY